MAQSTITANGIYTAGVNGADTFQLCGNTVGSGTATVYLNVSVASRGSGAGGSGAAGGTVTGTFTNTQFNQPFPFQSLSGQGGDLGALTITNLGGSTNKLTDGISSIINLPTSGVTNAFTNGFGAYLVNPNSNNAGQFGWTGAVGYYSQVWCRGGSQTNTRCWGANFSVSDDTSKPAFMFGNEYDFTINNNTSQGFGNLFSLRGNGQATGDNLPAIALQTPAGTGQWTSGFECQSAAMNASATLPYACVNIGGMGGTPGSQDSQFLWFTTTANSLHYNLHLLQDGYMILGNSTSGQTSFAIDGSNAAAGSASGLGITLKATAALSVNTLVKIDTANADSVVICTTTDTHCIGFVMGGTTYCGVGGSHCGIITAPGSKAVGILGTGTCAIGNNVVVDTTTNGRIKCQAGVPAQGAWIGEALSAQSTVGNTVDILTHFQ